MTASGNETQGVRRTVRRQRGLWLAGILLAGLASGPAQAHDLVRELREQGRFGTLLAALDAAGLTATVAGCKRCTLLAPNDGAFARLPEGTVAALLRPGNKGKLAAILTFHVIGKRVPAAAVPTKPTFVPTLNRSRAQVLAKRGGGQVQINGVRVVTADIRADNNIIHELRDVLWPGEIR